MTTFTPIQSAQALQAALDSQAPLITIDGKIEGLTSIKLAPNQILQGTTGSSLSFLAGQNGVCCTQNNTIADLTIYTDPAQQAILNDTTVNGLGTITLENVTTIGQVKILAKDAVKSGHIEINGLDVIYAEASQYQDRPHGYGVYVLQGALTIWNMQSDGTSVISARVVDVSTGRAGKPTVGSGVFISGTDNFGGQVYVSLLQTKEIHSQGNIPAGTADEISGGVFTVYRVFADLVHNTGSVTTYTQNDMVLDNWGEVDRWIADEKITSFGPSGIGFVNFGNLNELIVNAPIETFGTGSRGFNVYDGTLNYAAFDRIITHGNGAVGVQVSKPFGQLVVYRGIETFGGAGQSLVKGVLMNLSAIGLSIKQGGSIDSVKIDGGITTHGDNIAPLECLGVIQHLKINGGLNLLGPKTNTSSNANADTPTPAVKS